MIPHLKCKLPFELVLLGYENGCVMKWLSNLVDATMVRKI